MRTRLMSVLAAAGMAVGVAASLAAPGSAMAQPEERLTTGGRTMRGVRVTEARMAETLPVRKITLYRSGVGYFERSGSVDGKAEIQLRFNTDQINDILKSMVLLDLDGGRIESVSYGSKEPLGKRLASFGVNIADNPSIPQLLGQLRGASINVAFPGGTVTGTILGVEERTLPPGKDQQPVKVPHLNLVTPNGLKSIAITDISSFEILDKELADELNKALATLAEYRADRTKTVDLRFAGEGARRVVVGYIHEMPVWKVSYRLVLPDVPAAAKEKSAKGDLTLQGWAIVENTTDQDWNEVQMALVSGRPVSFQMDLYEPLFTFRPFLPVPTIPGVMPRAYAGGIENQAMEQAGISGGVSAGQYRGQDRDAAGKEGARMRRSPATPGAPAPAMKAADMAGRGEAEEKRAYAGVTGEDLAGYAAAAQAQAAEVGEVFQFQLDAPVSIERQRSAMIPILSANVQGRRVSIFNIADVAGGEGGGHPMRGIEVVNDSDLQLLPGPISVFDGAAYAGDAQIGHIPKGDKRLLAYAVDLDVDVQTKQENTSNITKLRIVDGMFEQTVKSETKLTYTFANKDEKRSRTMIVEHPKGDPGWNLVNPKKAEEETQTLYRFGVEIDAGKTVVLPVVGERTDRQTVGVMNYDMPTLLAFHKNGKLSDKVLEAVRQVAAKQSDINTTERQINELNEQTGAITAEQNRIRENMGKIERTSQLYTRYMTKLNDQETLLEDINDKRKAAQEKLETQRREFNEFVRGLNVE